MPTRFVQSSTIAAESYTGSHCGVGYNPTDDQFYVNPDGTKRAVMTGRGNARVLTSTTTLTAADFGKTIFLNAATEFVTTLPSPVLGARLKIVCANAPESASFTVVTASSANVIYGAIVSSADAGGSASSTAGTPGDTITFVDGQAAVGDFVQLESDGTNWYAFGVCGDEDGITITAAS